MKPLILGSVPDTQSLYTIYKVVFISLFVIAYSSHVEQGGVGDGVNVGEGVSDGLGQLQSPHPPISDIAFTVGVSVVVDNNV